MTAPSPTLSDPGSARLPWLIAVYIFCVVVPISFYAGPLYMTTLRLLLLVITVPFLLRLLAGKYGPTIPTDWLFLAHTLWIAVAIGRNNPDQVVQQAPSVGIEFLGGYVLARALIRTPEQFLAAFKFVAVTVLLTMPFALYEAKTGTPLIVTTLRALPSLSSVPVVTIEGRLGLERVQANFAHPIHYGLYCSVAFSMVYVAMEGLVGTFRRLVVSGLVALCGFLALSSGALLAILLQMALITWATVFARLSWRWWLLVGLFALAYVVVDILSNRTPIRVFMSYATFSAHNAYWRAQIFEWGMKNVWGSPIFGIGLNDWVRPHYMHSGSMDNFWLVMAVRYGIPGFLLIAAGWLWALVKIMRRPFAADRRIVLIRRAYVFTFIGLTLTLCTVHVWTNIFSFVFFVFGAGAWLVHWPVEARDHVPDAAADMLGGRGLVFTRFPTTPADHLYSRRSALPSQ